MLVVSFVICALLSICTERCDLVLKCAVFRLLEKLSSPGSGCDGPSLYLNLWGISPHTIDLANTVELVTLFRPVPADVHNYSLTSSCY